VNNRSLGTKRAVEYLCSKPSLLCKSNFGFTMDNSSTKPQPSPATFATVFSNRLIYNKIFTCLSAASVIRFSGMSRIARFAALDYLQTAFNINLFLARLFKDPLGFRSLQASTGFLISGSAALQFFDRSYSPESDLDLYVAPCTTLQIGNWLMDGEGYEFLPNFVQNKAFETSVGDSQQANNNLLCVDAVYSFLSQPSVRFRIPGRSRSCRQLCLISNAFCASTPVSPPF
jgi:hypothetical protein